MIDVDIICVIAGMETMHTRLREARLGAGFSSAAKAAKSLGMSASTYAAHENGQNEFDAETAKVYGRRFKVSPAWLLTGEHDELRRVPSGQEFEPDPVFETPKAAISSERRFGIGSDEIPQAETLGLGLRDAGDQIQIDIGGGSSVIGVPVSDTWRVPSTVLRRRVSTPIEQLHFVECEGNSMLPMIHNGDVVLVDRSKRNPRMPGVFALWEGDGQTIKQVEFVPGSTPPKLRLIPANKDYTTYEVLAEDVVIIGAYVARFTVD